MATAKFLAELLEKFGFPVAFAAGALWLLWWFIRDQKAERKEIMAAHRDERKSWAEQYEKLNDRSDANAKAVTKAMHDLERVITLQEFRK